MGQRSRFVQPDIVRLPLSDNDWIDIKKELNTGEQRRVFSDFVKTARTGEEWTVDPEKVGMTKVLAYLLAWSFVDADGKPVDVSEGAIKSLNIASFREVKDAIDAHDAQIEKDREARKNETGTPVASVAT
jgi:hypothetical protein